MKETMGVRDFFTKGEKVWISENFRNLILDGYTQTTNKSTDMAMTAVDLQDIRSDSDPTDFIFADPDIFLEQLADLINKQIDGEAGPLLNDSSANYFFLSAKDGKYYSILVRWEPAQKLWRCGAYLQEELKFPNVRIFCSQ